MPETRTPVWNSSKRLLGNLVPALFCIPFLVVAVLQFKPDKPWANWPFWMGAFLVVGWVALAVFGYWGNDTMRSAIGRRFDRKYPPGTVDLPRFFVGIARPGFKNIWDPHEDVGFLVLHPDHLEFFGDSLALNISRSSFQSVRFRANPHTLVGIGRWVSLEGESDGTVIRLYIESREKSVLVLNRAIGTKIKGVLEDWLGVDTQTDIPKG
ncbi:MAG: hypothetical protein K8R88_04180 [Armatimonadetes bacterium]|nr:hypothetical protein [Armatimonadota bacterium]